MIIYAPDVKIQLIVKDSDVGKIEGRRKRGWQRMRRLGSSTDSMDMSLSKLGGSDGQGSLVCCSPWGRNTLQVASIFLSALWSPHCSPAMPCSLGSVPINYIFSSQELPLKLGQWEAVGGCRMERWNSLRIYLHLPACVASLAGQAAQFLGPGII